MNKEYFMSRLANGESMDTIGAEIAAMMNAAMAEHAAKVEAEKAAAQEKEVAKRELIEELVEIVQELAILEGMNADEISVTGEEIDQMVAAFTEMFAAMREVKKLVAQLETAKPAAAPKTSHIVAKSDDEVLADFIKMFS
jgi:hypothetical protein